MDATAAQNPQLLGHYEGLVRKTAGMCERYVEEDFDDICQFLRYKVWKALLAFDVKGLRKKPLTRKELNDARDRYVFSCLVNAKVDVLKKKRHNLLFIEDIAPAVDGRAASEGGAAPHDHRSARAAFEKRYLCVEDAYVSIEEELPVVPSTLTAAERSVLLLLYLDFKPAEIAEHEALARSEVSTLTRAIQEKMADWAPGSLEQVPLAA